MDRVNELRAELSSAIEAAVKPGYVYTYPPKRAFRPLDPTFRYEDAWHDWNASVNVYIHVPFCEVRCRFCNLFTVPLAPSRSRSITDEYTDALIAEIHSYRRLFGVKQAASIYFGGGTPTYLTVEQFRRIFDSLLDSFPPTTDAEVSVECYPDDASEPGKLEALRSFGVNRISFGIQTFDPDELDATGRPYPAELGVEVLARVKNLGFADWNADLIYGLPRQTLATWKDNLHRIGELQPTTVTLYPLMIRPVTAFGRQQKSGQVNFVPQETKFEWYEIGRHILATYGYRQQTTVRFVLPGKGGYRQQAKEFTGTPTLGLGAGARTAAPHIHYSTDYAVAYAPTLKIIRDFIERANADRPAATLGFVLADDEKARRYVVQAVQLPEGVASAVFERKFGMPLAKRFGPELAALQAEGCACETPDGGLVLTDKGRKYSDLCARLFFSPRVRELERNYVPV